MKILKTKVIQLLLCLLSFTGIAESLYSYEDKNMSSTLLPRYDVTDLSLIYNSGYSYSLPESVLQSFLLGKSFDNPDFYTSDEFELLKADINEIFQTIMSSEPVKSNLAVMTAGSPGSGKTFLLKQDLKQNLDENEMSFAYVCPDDVCLKNQNRTYIAELQANEASLTTRQNAYDKWRPGSNAATHLILANLIREKFSFYFGTTCSSPHTWKFLNFLKSHGYKIKILHVSAPEDVRWGSIQARDKTFVQTTEEDVKEKGLLVPQRINDTFLKYADEIEFYYRKAVSEDAVLAATWIRNNDLSESRSTLKIVNHEAYEGVKTIHNAAIEALNMPELALEKTIEAESIIL
jgi:Cdc6-like AAA superfamily ATPase